MPILPPQSRPIPGVARIIAIGSGKGGVGKTTVAVNLAMALSQLGASVGIFDADLYGPNVPLMLGVLRSEPGKGTIPVARMQRSPYIQPLSRFGIKVMSIGLLVSSEQTVLSDPRFQGHVIRQTMQDVLWGSLDYLLVDFPPGSGEPQQTLLASTEFNGVVIVTTPQDLSLMDTSRNLGLFQAAKVPILGVVENMSYFTCPHCGEPVEVFARSGRKWAIEGEGVELLGRVPLSVEISRAADLEDWANDPDHTDQQAARAVFTSIAEKVREKLQK